MVGLVNRLPLGRRDWPRRGRSTPSYIHDEYMQTIPPGRRTCERYLVLCRLVGCRLHFCRPPSIPKCSRTWRCPYRRRVIVVEPQLPFVARYFGTHVADAFRAHDSTCFDDRIFGNVAYARPRGHYVDTKANAIIMREKIKILGKSSDTDRWTRQYWHWFVCVSLRW